MRYYQSDNFHFTQAIQIRTTNPRPAVQQEDRDAYLSWFGNSAENQRKKKYKGAHVMIDLQLILKRTSHHKPLRTVLRNNLGSFCHPVRNLLF